MISFKCLDCNRSWPETATFQLKISPKARGRCPWCWSRKIRKVTPWRAMAQKRACDG